MKKGEGREEERKKSQEKEKWNREGGRVEGNKNKKTQVRSELRDSGRTAEESRGVEK